MMMHPAAVKAFKDITNQLLSNRSGDINKLLAWVSAKI
jgi:CO dehydrogenase/acetyl-CoA synthase delta subunit